MWHFVKCCTCVFFYLWIFICVFVFVYPVQNIIFDALGSLAYQKYSNLKVYKVFRAWWRLVRLPNPLLEVSRETWLYSWNFAHHSALTTFYLRLDGFEKNKVFTVGKTIAGHQRRQGVKRPRRKMFAISASDRPWHWLWRPPHWW